MSSQPPDSQGNDEPRPDDTAAFSRFYLGQPDPTHPEPERSVFYKIFVGWWRDR